MKQNQSEVMEQSEGSWNFNLAAKCVASCRKLLACLENVRAGIVAEFRADLAEQEHLLDLALNEAAALAWETGFPQLFFPALAVEKAAGVAAWNARQQALRQGHRLALAA